MQKEVEFLMKFLLKRTKNIKEKRYLSSEINVCVTDMTGLLDEECDYLYDIKE